MKWPFVSRERFEDMRAERDELKKERETLLDRISVMQGQRPLYGHVAPVEDTPYVPTGPMRPGRPTLEMVTSEANAAAAESAATNQGPVFMRALQEKMTVMRNKA